MSRYTSIYLADGRSLHDAAQFFVVEQTVKQEGLTSSMIEHLDQCVECGDSGDLQLCTGCPNAYHQGAHQSCRQSLYCNCSISVKRGHIFLTSLVFAFC